MTNGSKWRALSSAFVLMLLVGCGMAGTMHPHSGGAMRAAPGVNFEPGAGFVIVDQREPAFTVFIGVTKDTDEKRLAEIRSNISGQEKMGMLSWKQFITSVEGFAQSTILINDYPNVSVVDGLVCLVGNASGAPWGLTWNAGIALTFNDYEFARKRYASYSADPESYRPVSDPAADPVSPGGHLPAFGCAY